jgi:hypothetical protein
MTRAAMLPLAQVLSRPETMAGLGGRDWTTVVGQGHACALLARLAGVVRSAGLVESVPPAVRRHLESAEVVVSRQYQQALFEIGNVNEALRSAGCPTLLLKGAAYIALGVPAGEGRYLSDIDIMVPRQQIGVAESALMAAGWVTAEGDAYNQRYYRQWMHEIPPLRHLQRASVIDLHHTILPLTSRARLDADKLFAAARPVPGAPCLRVLSPVDMVLHSATHLFHEGELERGLRDLCDLESLVRTFEVQEPAFWSDLVPRAAELGLLLPLHYGLRYAREFLGTAVPAEVLAELARVAPAWPRQALMDALFRRALRPSHPSCDDAWTPVARSLLYLRGHWLRMPARLLLPHLLRKAWMRWQAGTAEQER